jgi:uncharacterized coiled-coil protein SlyX
VEYLERVVRKLDALLSDPREMREKGGWYTHRLMCLLGVEAPLEDRCESDLDDSDIMDWITSVHEEHERIMREALQAQSIVLTEEYSQAVVEEQRDQEAMCDHIDGMIRRWKDVRPLLFSRTSGASLRSQIASWTRSINLGRFDLQASASSYTSGSIETPVICLIFLSLIYLSSRRRGHYAAVYRDGRAAKSTRASRDVMRKQVSGVPLEQGIWN